MILSFSSMVLSNLNFFFALFPLLPFFTADIGKLCLSMGIEIVDMRKIDSTGNSACSHGFLFASTNLDITMPVNGCVASSKDRKGEKNIQIVQCLQKKAAVCFYPRLV